MFVFITSMPINFDLEKLRKIHNCINYFETGLWDPTSDISSKKALSCMFDNVWCIEIRPDWVNLGHEVFTPFNISNADYL